MKKLVFVFCVCLLAASAFARGPKEIKADLAKAQKQVSMTKNSSAEATKLKHKFIQLRAELHALNTRAENSRLDDGGETCDDATLIGELPYFDEGVIDEFTNDDYTSDTVDFHCGSNGADVVYELIIGDGYLPEDYYTISTCGSFFDTVLELWFGCPGSEGSYMVDCNDDADDDCDDDNGGYSSCIRDNFLENGVYYIIIDGFAFDQGGYVLNVNTFDNCNGDQGCAATAENSWCDGHQNLTLLEGQAYAQGNSSDGAFPYVVSDCNESIEACGLWFAVTGTGNLMQANTCDEATDYDTKLHVFTGPCDALECVVANDDWYDYEVGDYICGGFYLASGVEWCSEEGMTYYILVSGYGGYTGNFGLSVIDLGEPCEPPCPDHDYYFAGDQVPFCQCLSICPGQIQKIFIGPLGPNDYPTSSFGVGCSTERTIPPSDCEADCYPAYPELYMDWIYLPDQGLWCMDIYSDQGGCYCFCIDRLLPVELHDFAAIAGDGQVTINWTTASETDVDRFELVRDNLTVASVNAENTASGASYSWVDHGVENGSTYSYTLVLVNLDGSRENLATEQVTPNAAGSVVHEFALYQNYPNPFNPETNINFDLAEAGRVTLKVFNIAGQEIATLAQGTYNAGRHTVQFDGSSLASGVYLYRLEASGQIAQQKMILLK